MSNTFQKIIEQVLSSFEASPNEQQSIKKELENNLLDQKEHLIAKGMKPKQAEKEVAKKFGDPQTIGKMFHYNHLTKKREYAKIMACISGILSISAGIYYALRTTEAEMYLWSYLSILGGIGALISAKTIHLSKLSSLSTGGFLLLAAGQTLPIIAWMDAATYGRACYDEDVKWCVIDNNVFLGLLTHLGIFILCFLIISLLINRTKNSLHRIQ